MKTMRRLVAALLVLTMVLALSGTAMAENKFKVGDLVKFTKNTHLYDGHHNHKITDTIVRKGSIALVADTFGSHWVKLQITPYPDGDTSAKVHFKWFKVDNLKWVSPEKVMREITWTDGTGTKIDLGWTYIYVVFSNKGNGFSEPWRLYVDDTVHNKEHVKATSKVWMRKTYALKQNYGRALHDGDVVKYRRYVGFDSRFVGFYGIRYKGNNLWVSSEYSKLVK